MMNELIAATVQSAVYNNNPASITSSSGSGSLNLTFFVTIISGVLIFVLGRFIEKFVIDPWKDQKNAMGEILEVIMTYTNTIDNPPYVAVPDPNDDDVKRQIEVQLALRNANIRLITTTLAVSAYSIVAKITRRPSLSEIRKVWDLLVNISNNLNRKTAHDTLTGQSNKRNRQEVIILLKMEKFIESLNKAV